MIPCICIDSSNKPSEIYLGEWINKEAHYHITHVYYHPEQGIQGCELREVKLTDKSKPYVSYKLSRFGVTKENFAALIKMMKNCSELNSIDILSAIEASELIIIDK